MSRREEHFASFLKHRFPGNLSAVPCSEIDKHMVWRNSFWKRFMSSLSFTNRREWRAT
jgi:hypothetical protein